MVKEDPAALAVARAVEGDEELTAAARALAATAIATAQHFLTYGSPQTQVQIVRALMPAVGRAIVDRHDEDEGLADVRGQLRALQQAMLTGGSPDGD